MNYKDQNDASLVELTLLGNERAFEELVKRWQSAAMKSAVSITSNHYTAEDAVQDAFVTAWQRLDTLRDREKFGAWICRIARYRAINLAIRYREHIPFDLIENTEHEAFDDLIGYYDNELESKELMYHVENLSEKVKSVIKMFYFEGLSVETISKKMDLAVGTVKSRLHDGRIKLRKEMGLMDKNNEKETLLEAVMRRVNELKKWKLRKNKKGFEKEYNECLTEVEDLPESEQKYHALADVLNLGYWYLSNEKKEELEKRIKEAAIKGNNREVLGYSITRASDNLSGKAKIEFDLNEIIPELESYGLTEAIGSVYFWIGYEYFSSLHDVQSAKEYFEKAINILPPDDVHYATSKAAIEIFEKLGEVLNDKMKYVISCVGEEYRLDGSKLLFWSQPGFSPGWLQGFSKRSCDHPTYYISLTDGLMYDEEMKVGETVKSFDGTATLKLISDNEEIDTPCGAFHNCHVFVCKDIRFETTVYYKRNIGIVAYKHTSVIPQNSAEHAHAFFKLASYKINGGTGLIPFAEGNTWTYTSESVDGLCDYEIKYEVTYFDGKKVIVSHPSYKFKDSYNKKSWDDVIHYLRSFYVKELDENKECLNDVSKEMILAEQLAKTPWQKAHTAVANGVMRRIFATDPDYDPNAKEKGYRNFFNLLDVSKEDGKTYIFDNRDYGFEWKEYVHEARPLLYNDLYCILSENIGCLWNDNIKAGDEFTYTCPVFRKDTEFVCNAKVETCEPIETKAGRFENCIKLSYSSNHETWTNGVLFRVVDADWYFAEGIGLVKTVFKLDNFTREIIYELSSYKGEGSGYMPIIPDIERFYELVGEDPKLHGSVRYVYAIDDDGDLKILTDQKGTIDI